MENQVNIDPKRHRKNDAKKQATKIANKTIFDSREGPYTVTTPPLVPALVPLPRGVQISGIWIPSGRGKGRG